LQTFSQVLQKAGDPAAAEHSKGNDAAPRTTSARRCAERSDMQRVRSALTKTVNNQVSPTPMIEAKYPFGVQCHLMLNAMTAKMMADWSSYHIGSLLMAQ
jgi:hypothetical protein